MTDNNGCETHHTFRSDHGDGEHCIRCNAKLCTFCAGINGHRQGCPEDNEVVAATNWPRDPLSTRAFAWFMEIVRRLMMLTPARRRMREHKGWLKP